MLAHQTGQPDHRGRRRGGRPVLAKSPICPRRSARGWWRGGLDRFQRVRRRRVGSGGAPNPQGPTVASRNEAAFQGGGKTELIHSMDATAASVHNPNVRGDLLQAAA